MKRLEGVHPKVRELAERLIEEAAKKGITIIVTQGLRTHEEQNALYAKGRTVNGEPCKHGGRFHPLGTCAVHPRGLTVTNAKGGSSYHNFGLAFDIAVVKDGTPTWSENVDLNHDAVWDYVSVGHLGEGLGLEWGGRWKYRDVPHFQLTFGLSLAELREGKMPPHEDITGGYTCGFERGVPA